LATAVPARSTIYADTYPRTIEKEANSGDPNATKPVIYRLDFKRIATKTAFWAGRLAMRIVQALTWFRDERSNFETIVDGVVRLSRKACKSDRSSRICAITFARFLRECIP